MEIRYPQAGRAALEGLDLDIGAGERLAAIGESGSGKSTLARALAGLLPPGTAVGGRIEWPAIGRKPRPGRDFGFVFQEPGQSLDPVMRVGRQLAEVLDATRDLRGSGAEAESQRLLERVQLPARALRAFPHELSGGQKQRVGLALALAGRPRILIADEPTSALDAVVQKDVAELIGALVSDEGMALLIVTHDLALAAGLADRIAVLRDGRVVELGATGAVIGRPAHAYTRELLDAHRELAAS